MLNTISLMGRLTHSPDVRKTPSDISVTTMTLAVERDYKDKDGNKPTDFIDVVAYRSTADFIGRYFQKGQLVAVTGRIQVRSYEDKDGNKRKAVEVIAESVYFAESAKKPESKPPEKPTEPFVPPENPADYEPIPDGDLPF